MVAAGKVDPRRFLLSQVARQLSCEVEQRSVRYAVRQTEEEYHEFTVKVYGAGTPVEAV